MCQTPIIGVLYRKGHAQDRDALVTGTDTPVHRFPYLVLLRLRFNFTDWIMEQRGVPHPHLVIEIQLN